MLSRGIDVQQVAVVINYDLPMEKEVYMHRIGRSGRFGRKGIAINFITKDDIPKIREIEGQLSLPVFFFFLVSGSGLTIITQSITTPRSKKCLLIFRKSSYSLLILPLFLCYLPPCFSILLKHMSLSN